MLGTATTPGQGQKAQKQRPLRCRLCQLAAYAVFWLAIAALILAVVYNGGVSLTVAAMIAGSIAIAVVPLLLFGAWGRSIALGKGRSGNTWFAACALTGLIGVVVLLTLPRLTPQRR